MEANKTTLYFYIDHKHLPIYIGKSKNGFDSRFHGHDFSKKTFLKTKTVLVVEDTEDLEPLLIGFYKPQQNKHYINLPYSYIEDQRKAKLERKSYDTLQSFSIQKIPFSIYSIIQKSNFEGANSTKRKIAVYAEMAVSDVINNLALKEEEKRLENEHKQIVREKEFEKELENGYSWMILKVSEDTKEFYKSFRKKYRKQNDESSMNLFLNQMILNYLDNKISIDQTKLSQTRSELTTSIALEINKKTKYDYRKRIKDIPNRKYIPELLINEFMKNYRI